MRLLGYVVFNRRGVVGARRNVPSLKSGEAALRIDLTLKSGEAALRIDLTLSDDYFKAAFPKVKIDLAGEQVIVPTVIRLDQKAIAAARAAEEKKAATSQPTKLGGRV